MAEVRKNTEASRYQVLVDGQVVGRLEYTDIDGRYTLVHTEVDPSQKGKGLGDELAAFAFQDVRTAGRTTRVECGFVRKYVSRHPEVQDLVEE